jgi:hypothetical protein
MLAAFSVRGSSRPTFGAPQITRSWSRTIYHAPGSRRAPPLLLWVNLADFTHQPQKGETALVKIGADEMQASHTRDHKQ